MSRRFLRTFLAITVLAVTIIIFVYYIKNHPDIIRQLRQIPPLIFVGLLALYCVFLGTLIWIQRATLNLCGIKLDGKESMLLVTYSSIINFFGPLQSGPAFRAAYLKRKHNVNLKQYSLATLLYYAFYAAFSGLFLLTYFTGFIGLLGILLIVLVGPWLLRRKNLLPERLKKLQLQHIGQLATATLAQVSVLAVIFYTELNSLGNQIGQIPSLIYTGAANFALFVSITPGAIGFRESFVKFAQDLHHIADAQIITASLIDRGVYITFLGILAAIVFGLQAQNYLKK